MSTLATVIAPEFSLQAIYAPTPHPLAVVAWLLLVPVAAGHVGVAVLDRCDRAPAGSWTAVTGGWVLVGILSSVAVLGARDFEPTLPFVLAVLGTAAGMLARD